MSTRIHIIAGESIPYAKEAFETLGTVRFLPGRTISAADLEGAHTLLVRSITRVDEALLHGTSIEFVGSASAGVDHIDAAYLQTRNINCASAPGSNANSVAEYVIASLLILAKQEGFTLSGKTIGIVGVGHIGKLVKKKAEAIGLHPVLHDPPLADLGKITQSSLQETLGCDIVTLHTPLTTDGPHPTFHLLNERSFTHLKPSTIFINAARGEVVDTNALLTAITRKRIGPVVLDVWEHEPHIHWDLFNAVTIGTPHIAGHSLDGKANGTNMIYIALCRHLGVEPIWKPAHSLPTPVVPSLEMDSQPKSDEEHLREMIQKIYDWKADHHRMKELLASPPEERPMLFDSLRKNYPVRREFHRTQVKLPKNMSELKHMLAGLGFGEISESGT